MSKDTGSFHFRQEIGEFMLKISPKLQARDLLMQVQSSLNGYHITRVQSGYYVETHLPDASARPTLPNTCTPVWIFYGKKRELISNPSR